MPSWLLFQASLKWLVEEFPSSGINSNCSCFFRNCNKEAKWFRGSKLFPGSVLCPIHFFQKSWELTFKGLCHPSVYHFLFSKDHKVAKSSLHGLDQLNCLPRVSSSDRKLTITPVWGAISCADLKLLLETSGIFSYAAEWSCIDLHSYWMVLQGYVLKGALCLNVKNSFWVGLARRPLL